MRIRDLNVAFDIGLSEYPKNTIDYITEKLAPMRANIRGQIWIDEFKENIFGMYPIVVSTSDRLRPNRIATLLLVRDLTRLKAHSHRTLLSSLSPIFFFLVFAPLLLGAVLHMMISRRAQRSVYFTDAFSESDYSVKAPEKGRDELSMLGAALNKMAYKVRHDQHRLRKHYGNVLDETGLSHLQRVCAATRRMAQLIDDLLELSRVTRHELHYTEVDLTAMAETIIEHLREKDTSRFVTVDIEAGVTGFADKRLMRIVLVNIIDNAWKYTSKGATAHIQFGIKKKRGETIYYVRDNGAGFDMRYTDKLFGPFQRLHTEGEFEGTGIGLATVERIIHRHGGRIWAESIVDEGATFFFTLPKPTTLTVSASLAPIEHPR